MPDKGLTVAAYAAGLSLLTISAFYVFSPSFFIDGEHSSTTNDGRKRTIVGLSNPANDCFINSVLQALAGLGDLRLYLIREIHRRSLDDPEIYDTLPLVLKKGDKPEKILNLQKEPVTKALKDMLNALNERPIYRKTITARPMIEALEKAFNTRISRNQQDAQEFLQIVLERLCDEYHASQAARVRYQHKLQGVPDSTEAQEQSPTSETSEDKTSATIADSDGFVFEGRIESQIQCMHCGFRTKPSLMTFVSLTLNVPQKSSTSLDNCFDILLKTEDIDDYRCDKCRLQHALEWKNKKIQTVKDEKEQISLQDDISLLQQAIEDDPEKPPDGVTLPDSNQAPKRRIKKHTRITVFPKVMAIHLSRSVFDPGSYSTKNQAKVSYTQRLRLGGILNERWYKLLGIVCHKGSHNSGHYESFRRNHIYPPFATPDAFAAYAAASRNDSIINPARASQETPISGSSPTIQPSVSLSESNGDSRSSSQRYSVSDSTPKSPTSVRMSLSRTDIQTLQPQIKSHDSQARFRRRKKSNDRWWRISDDKIKEARTSDVLGMQREVYLLFYELERPGDDSAA